MAAFFKVMTPSSTTSSTAYALSERFDKFFAKLNPGDNFIRIAAREHTAITGLIEDQYAACSSLSPQCFLQGSYKQKTAIHSINDVDIVVMCDELSFPGSGGGGKSWSRDEIFAAIASPLLADSYYRNKVEYSANSTCIKVKGDIKVEILPVVRSAGKAADSEPFYLWRPERQKWEEGFARKHQTHLTVKNALTEGNFIPAVKVFKHLRDRFFPSVSFHIECLLHSFPDPLYTGGPAIYLNKLFNHVAATSASDWYVKYLPTPCGDRDIFKEEEWKREEWNSFHKVITLLAGAATSANYATSEVEAVKMWRLILGEDMFPA